MKQRWHRTLFASLQKHVIGGCLPSQSAHEKHNQEKSPQIKEVVKFNHMVTASCHAVFECGPTVLSVRDRVFFLFDTTYIS